MKDKNKRMNFLISYLTTFTSCARFRVIKRSVRCQGKCEVVKLLNVGAFFTFVLLFARGADSHSEKREHESQIAF